MLHGVVSCSLFQIQNQLFLFMFLQHRDTHSALLAVGQKLVFFFGVEDERVRREGDGLALEGGTFVRAYKEHLVPLING